MNDKPNIYVAYEQYVKNRTADKGIIHAINASIAASEVLSAFSSPFNPYASTHFISAQIGKTIYHFMQLAKLHNLELGYILRQHLEHMKIEDSQNEKQP